jgi:glycosyltransferase involved in cell wall biosynthesis
MDEDTWIDAIDEPYRSRCWEAMRQTAPEVDAFIAVSRHYAGVIRQRLSIPDERMHIVRVGIDMEGYRPARDQDPPVVGYLSRMSEGLGLDILVDAFIKLRTERASLGGTRLRAMGGATGDDRLFVEQLKARLASRGMSDAVEFCPELDRPSRIAFLESLSVLSVPIPGGAAFGTFIIEALAAGVPVVQPAVGGFRELVELTGGGVLFEPVEPAPLAEALYRLLADRPRARELARRGRERVLKDFTIERMADETLAVYAAVAGGGA